ncbi:PaaX family transcriptional regulator [Nocardia higoensis]|uniref:PaaX family transcriptional regulator n=1 Tax=Nocardia higoensis TaxID=228599 RepID=A0ABS0D600_9NOCA|nr:PaaX family transcriptional regulator C-terminal domain-containing protein [Nocardia higoensis]MBF6353902.1 PaaX family transcriptional regulator [Nocardia higoensis]
MTAEIESTGAAGGRDTRLAQFIITIFGLCARAEGNWLSVASVVALMADLGAEGQAVRSSISRLKRRNVLVSERHAGAAGYSPAPQTLEALAEGDTRIFHRTRATEDDGWVVAVFSVPESEREKRHSLRTTLTRLGYGTAAPGVWVAPGNLARETEQMLQRRELSSYVDLFTGRHLGFGDLREKVTTWWDLDELTALYTEFLQRYRPVLYRVTSEDITPCEAFQLYVPMLTQWRRLPYLDPGIPLSLLPPAWPGEAAGTLFDQLNEALSSPAHKHALAVIHGKRSPGA